MSHCTQTHKHTELSLSFGSNLEQVVEVLQVGLDILENEYKTIQNWLYAVTCDH